MREKLWNRNYLCAWGANFTLFFSFMLIVPLLPIYLQERFGASKETIGIVLSGYTIVAMLTRATSGYVVDRFPRKQVLVFGFVLLFAFFFGYILAGTLLLFAIVRTVHGFPFGVSTVANSTVAIDVLPPSRQAEGIGYYGLSNNVATAISPTIGLWIYQITGNFDILFVCSLAVSLLGVIMVRRIDYPVAEAEKPDHDIALKDNLFLVAGWRQGLAIACYSFAYGVVSTYVAIYGKEELGISSGAGVFFALLASGLIVSRLFGSRSLRKGRVVHNATMGVCLSCVGYLLFAALHNEVGYYGCAILVGLGNGHLWPAFQTMFVSMAPAAKRGVANASLLTSWDLGVGLGVIAGGSLIERFSYHTAFWWAWTIEAAGVLFYLLRVRGQYHPLPQSE